MLEPFDAAKATANIVAHFEDLTKAHEAVQRAQSQLAALTPLLKDCGAYDAVDDEIKALNAQREALKYYFADAKAELLDRLLENLSSERRGLTAQRDGLGEQLKGLRERETQLRVDRAGHGGNRLAEIERQMAEGEKTRAARMARAQRFGNLLGEAGLDPVQTAAQFAARRGEITAAHQRATQAADDCQKRLKDIAGDERPLREESEKVNAELRSLRARKSNIPTRNLDIRRLLCQELKLTESALPFAGELIAVLEHESDWEGAAERLLHSFALSILVPDEHYARRRRLDQRSLPERPGGVLPGARDGRRVTRYGARGTRRPRQPGSAARNPLAAKLNVRDTPFASWVEDELATRADYDASRPWTNSAGRRGPSPRPGRSRARAGGTRRTTGPASTTAARTCSAGPTSGRSTRCCGRQPRSRGGQRAHGGRGQAQGGLDAAIKRGQVLAGLDQTSEFAEIDCHSDVNRIAELKASTPS